jgi:antibiotic biosynthesis monooxygenase (ABM) superfamily enzyme
MPIHVAIVRRAKLGSESEFEQALRDFLHDSFADPAVMGATLLVPPPGSASREFGILRTFRDETERDAFYASPFFRRWEEWARQHTEGETERRELHGLEAWFRASVEQPPRWKMALVTFAGVYPLTSSIPPVFTWLFPTSHPLLVNAGATALIVVLLTWAIMPVLTQLCEGWIHHKRRTP